MSRARSGLTAGLAAIFVLGAVLPAFAAERIALRAWPHPDFARLVFDWKSPVSYEVGIDGRVLSVVFDRDLETSFAEVQTNLGDQISEARLGDDGRTVRFTLKADYELRHFVADGSVVLDLLQSGPEAKADGRASVPVRTGQHDKFSRVVFDWPSVVDYQVAETDGAVTLRFSRPATIDLSAVTRDPPREIASAEQSDDSDATTVVLGITAGSRIRHFRDGFKIVVDVQRTTEPEIEDTSAARTAEPAEADEQPAPVETAQTPPEPPVQITEALAQRPAAVQDREVTATSATAPPTPQGTELHVASEEQGKATAAPTALVPTGHAAEGGSAPDSVDAGHGEDEPTEAAEGDDDNAAPEEFEVTFTRSADGGVLSFPFHRRTGAAAFRRSGRLWLVFDTPAAVDPRAILDIAQDVVLGVEKVVVDGALVLRLDTIPGFNPTLETDGNEWLVTIRPQTLDPATRLDVTVSSDVAGGGTVVVPVGAVSKKVTLSDPEVGDRISVVTLKAPGVGVSTERSFVGFALLESAQGVAVVPARDDIEVQANRKGVVIGADGGLAITTVRERSQIKQAAGGANVVRRYFDFDGWRGADGQYEETKQALQLHVATTGGDDRDAARLDLARFYFAHGQSERVLGVLAAITRDGGTAGRSPEFKALRGAAAYLARRSDLAATDLADRRLDDEPEIGLWRAALTADQGDWPAAAAGLQDSELYVQRYPDDLRAQFSLLGADASLRVDDSIGAKAWLESLRGVSLNETDNGLAKVYLGMVLADNGQFEEAMEKFDQAIAGDDRKSRALAMFERANLQLEIGEADEQEVLGDLDRLRYAWRGDDLEFSVLRRLGQLRVESDDYRDGLQMMRRAAANYPQHPEVEGLTELMQKTFSDLYLHGGADVMPAVRAIAIFNEFRELTPTGSEGDEMIRRLADRLVSVDLLEQAAELLTHQMEFRVEGEEKAGVGTRLAILHLMDRRPEEALQALRDSEVRTMPAALFDERVLLQARSYSEMGQIEDALKRIAQDDRVEADRLRADIFMRVQDYPRAVEVLTRLVGAAPAAGQVLAAERSVRVLNLAVALNLAGDRRGLDTLRERFGPAMETTEFANDFRVIASKDTNSRELRNALSRVAAVDDFKAFIEAYRDRLALPADGTTLVN